MKPLFSLEGKVAIVTGSGRGIGKATALQLADAGADVVVLARTAADIEKTADEIRARGRRALAVPTDVRASDQVASMVKKALDTFGRVDVLVNNAGASFPLATLQLSEGAWDALVRENLKTPYLCCKAVAEAMMKQGGGSIVNISSTEGLRAFATNAAYAAAKAGVISLTHSLAVEWAQYKIRVNCICPGFIANPLMPQALEQDKSLAEKLARVPMKHVGQPEDIGAGVIYLASDAAKYVTGAVLIIDGGFSSVLG
ncbi:MAG: SDR family NAD(P)-dependent oxidoreductase [Chloroflexi bacterium]|nr:SDR family NAD(P)-dependent oxidoreductase [Chloroflexota bacterium]